MSDRTKPTWLQRWGHDSNEPTEEDLHQQKEFEAEINRAVDDRRNAELRDTE